jgi:hypothetical protein
MSVLATIHREDSGSMFFDLLPDSRFHRHGANRLRSRKSSMHRLHSPQQ